MNYTEARSKILTGDMIAVKRRSGLLPNLTRFLTSSPHTHTGTAMWCGGRLLVTEINGGGNHLTPLSQFTPYGFDVFECPVDRLEYEICAWNSLGENVIYSMRDLVAAAFGAMMHLRLPTSSHGLICSAYTARDYIGAGWVENLPEIPTPADIAKDLVFKFSVDN